MRTRELEQVLNESGGFVLRRLHPELRTAIDWAVRRGRLQPLLPGTYSAWSPFAFPDLALRAALMTYPDAVAVRRTAARLSYLPKLDSLPIELAVERPRPDRTVFAFSHRHVPPELITTCGPVRLTTPALTAIDLASWEDSDAIDTALRTRVTTLALMYEALALTPNRPGIVERARLLVDSVAVPWSRAERRGHRLLRAARIRGWRANLPIVLAGQQYYIDIAFPQHKLAIEIDGRLHETDEDLFESDRWRQNALVAAGWQVLRFTWAMLRDHPEAVVAAIRAELP